MAQQSNLIELQSWWNEISFPEKELFHLKDNGELVLRAGENNKERLISALTPENAEIVIKALQEKFPEVEAKVKELQVEWVQAEDKLKLAGKVERIKDYLQHTNAIGNFNTLLHEVKDWENTIAALSEENYQVKLKLVEQGEALIESNNFKETTQAFRDIADKWKQTGYSDRHKSDALWNRLEAARNKFYERKRQSQDDHEKEMMQNLDLKMELAEKAENLAMSEDWKATSEIFRQLMEQWKTIGRATNDKNEELWNRFITAKNTFYDRKKANFESIQQEQETNYKLKLALVEKAEAVKDSTDWAATTQAYADLMEEWKNIGRVPIEKADELWNQLNAAKEVFFQAKRTNFESMRLSLEDNYAQKIAILKRAEALKNATNWREATEEMNELMVEWKKIGAVPREHSNNIWNQFLAARKHFFERKDANREERKKLAEKHKHVRLQQAQSFLQKLHDEIKEEEERLLDFRSGLENITPGRKEQELRSHLENLIRQGEAKLKSKHEKIAEVTQELEGQEKKAQPAERSQPAEEEENKNSENE
jgi:hypothetical protein